jgi:hypothetical protein
MLQREVLYRLIENFLFKNITLSQKLISHFSVALISIGELKRIYWTFTIVFTCSVMADESI